jgi:hypothetical protein
MTQKILSEEEKTELMSMAFGYGFPIARLLVLKELVYKRKNLLPNEDTAENRAVLDGCIEKLKSVMAASNIGSRPFRTSVGDVCLGAFTRGDKLLYSSHPNSPPDHMPIVDSDEVKLHETILNEMVNEVYLYVDMYVSLMMHESDAAIYNMACAILGCDRLTTVTEEIHVPVTPSETDDRRWVVKKCQCIAMMKDTDEHPKIGHYFAAPVFAVEL